MVSTLEASPRDAKDTIRNLGRALAEERWAAFRFVGGIPVHF